jgi:hypothetical protein
MTSLTKIVLTSIIPTAAIILGACAPINGELIDSAKEVTSGRAQNLFEKYCGSAKGLKEGYLYNINIYKGIGENGGDVFSVTALGYGTSASCTSEEGHNPDPWGILK